MKTLVLLVGAQGSGKTSFAKERLKGYFRISQDDMGKDRHKKEFHAALARGEEFIVVDRINHTRQQRSLYLDAARKAGYHTRLVWLNTERNLCTERCKARKGHPTLPPENVDAALEMFYRNFQLPARREADELEIIGKNPDNPAYVPIKDICREIGDRRFVIVGDIHGCLLELQELLAQMSFNPEEDVLISTGDIVDRGPKIKETIEYLMSLPRFYSVKGNHDDKCVRYFEGKQVKVGHGLDLTIQAYEGKMPTEVVNWLRDMPLILKTPAGYVVHAGFDPFSPPEEQSKQDCLYMRYFGGGSYFDDVGGTLWYTLWAKSNPRVFFGHLAEESGQTAPSFVSLDGACVFGGYMKGFDSKDGIVYFANAKQRYAISDHMGKANA